MSFMQEDRSQDKIREAQFKFGESVRCMSAGGNFMKAVF